MIAETVDRYSKLGWMSVAETPTLTRHSKIMQGRDLLIWFFKKVAGDTGYNPISVFIDTADQFNGFSEAYKFLSKPVASACMPKNYFNSKYKHRISI